MAHKLWSKAKGRPLRSGFVKVDCTGTAVEEDIVAGVTGKRIIPVWFCSWNAKTDGDSTSYTIVLRGKTDNNNRVFGKITVTEYAWPFFVNFDINHMNILDEGETLEAAVVGEATHDVDIHVGYYLI